MNFNEAEIAVMESGYIYCRFPDREVTIPNDSTNNDYVAYLAWKNASE